MRRVKTLVVGVALAGFLLGFVNGYFKSPVQEERGPAALSGPRPRADGGVPSLNTFDNLTCFSDERYREVAEGLKLKLEIPPNHCADPLHGKLSRVLRLMETTRPKLPPSWAPTLHGNLEDPIGFVSRMTSELNIDLTQTTAIAYNRTAERKIFLGGRFFVDTPLESISTLMHEARHSHPNDPGHTTCAMGNIPRADGGCDQNFSIDDGTAGAYSYGTAVYAAMALYSPLLSEGDREFLKTAALAQLGSRFNRIVPELALRFDLLVGLGREGELRVVHPFTGKAFATHPRNLKRIKFNVVNNGVMGFTAEDQLFAWSLSGGFERPFPDLVSEQERILEWERIRIPFEDYPYNTFLGLEQSLTHLKFNPDLGKMVRLPVEFFHGSGRGFQMPDIKAFELGMGIESFYLGKTGTLYVSQRFGVEDPIWARPELNTRAWIAFTGGVVHEGLYLLDFEGRLHSATQEWKSQGDHDEVLYPTRPVDAQNASGWVEYVEGLNLRAALDREGRVHLASHLENAFKPLAGAGPFRDIVLARQLLASPGLLRHLKVDPEFRRCGAVTEIPDPWLEGGIGLDREGALVFGVKSLTGMDCQPALDKREFRSVRIAHERPDVKDPYEFPVPVLELETKTGEKVILRPYR